MRWRRCQYGWLRSDGEVFLERGGILTDTGHHNWCVWIRALDSQLVHENGLTWATGTDSACELSKLAGSPVDRDGWFIQVGDEGWLRDAKRSAELHLKDRDNKR